VTAQFGTIPQESGAIQLFDDSSAEPMVQSMRIFNMFDIDKNGKIDLNEVKVISKSIGIHPTAAEEFVTLRTRTRVVGEAQ
jgi:Ca2+-binding EF-hand superfamily protein